MRLARAKFARVILAASPIFALDALRGQTKATTPSFEVSAIRPAEFPSPQGFRGGGPQGFRAGMQLDAGRLDWRLASLADMIQYAFHVTNYQLSGPDWMRSSRWNVQARLPADASPAQVPQMMQALLAERFGLKIHHDRRDQPVYALEVGKGGPKLETFDPSGDAAVGDATAAPSAGPSGPGLFPGPFGGPVGRGPDAPPGGAPDGRGGRGPGSMTMTGANGATARMSQGEGCTLRLELSKLTMQDLADTLAPFFDKPVVDATQLKGTYKATLDLPMEAMFTMIQNTMRANGMPDPGQGGFGRGPGDAGPGGPGGPGGRGGPQGCDPGTILGNGAGDTSSAAIVRAVQKLGLKLEARKAPFDTIIVDHLEKTPTEN